MKTKKDMICRFTKMQAYGNDYVYIDAIRQELPSDLSSLAVWISDRHYAVGSDGMVLICPSQRGDFRMRMFNPDGTEGEMCGNALRSLGKFVFEHHMTEKHELKIETLGGMKELTLAVRDGKAVNIRAMIGTPELRCVKIPVVFPKEQLVHERVTVLGRDFYLTAMSWGNPHCVVFAENVDSLDVEKYGSAIENMTNLFPKKTNVTFAQVIRPDFIKIREWERGTGETLGCGTGCCSAVAAGVINGLCEPRADLQQPGGILQVSWQREQGRMYMTGPSNTVFEGEIVLPGSFQWETEEERRQQ